VISPTHSLLALAILSKKGEPKRNWAVFIGSILPDLVIYLWAPYQYFINDVSGAEMWSELYFAAPMQNLIAYFNSIPIYGALALIGLAARSKLWGKCLLFFALAALIHLATDLPVHADDAYRHFWPLSDWRFYSPLSYWDTDHHANWVGLIDIALAIGAIILLWQRFPMKWARLILGFLSVVYLLVLLSSVLR
jgi:hypothetical protein